MKEYRREVFGTSVFCSDGKKDSTSAAVDVFVLKADGPAVERYSVILSHKRSL